MNIEPNRLLELLRDSLLEQGFSLFPRIDTINLLYPWLRLRYVDPNNGEPINYSNCYLFFIQDNFNNTKGIGARVLPYQQDDCEILFVFNHADYIIETIDKNYPQTIDDETTLSYCFTHIEEMDFVSIHKNTLDKELTRIYL